MVIYHSSITSHTVLTHVACSLHLVLSVYEIVNDLGKSNKMYQLVVKYESTLIIIQQQNDATS